MVNRDGPPGGARPNVGELRPLADAGLTDEVVAGVLEAAPDAIFVVDEQGRIVLANRRAEEQFGYDRIELLGETVDLLVPAAVRKVHAAHRLRYRADPVTRPMGAGLELWGRRRDGSEVPVEIALSPTSGRGETLTIVVVRDVSERRAGDAQVRRVQAALDATRDGVYLFDPESLRFSYVNEGAVAQSGYTRDELLHMTPLHLTAELNGEELAKLLDRIVVGDDVLVEVTTTLRRRDGVDVPIELMLQHVAPIHDDPAVVVAVARDVADRLRTQQHILDAARERATAADRERIAHDLHERVIQRLFAAGLTLQPLVTMVADGPARARVDQAIEELDASIHDLRDAIFGLDTPRPAPTALREAAVEVVVEASRSLGFEPAIHFDGVNDDDVPAELTAEALAVLRETLSGIALEARAASVEITVSARGSLRMSVTDDDGTAVDWEAPLLVDGPAGTG